MVWSETKRGKASEKVAAVRVHESPSESRYLRRRDGPTEASGM